ncbi:M50 family metallopeptidase [Lachnobacterium bovis]|uniref:M50 family metallopeptidase n=1 Tax=Lachnobacterium bovis TaxID=140626 RepID=UPI00048A0DA8|nr:M50 family metallopeptidase [Lachnobacterium bovis]
MTYDFIKTKPYEIGEHTKDNKIILSFDKKHHIKLSATAKKILDKFDGSSSLEDIHLALEKEEINLSTEELSIFVDKILVPNSLIEGTEYVPNKDSLLWLKIELFETDKLSFLFEKLTFFYKKSIVFFMLFLIFCSISYSSYALVSNHMNLKSVNSVKILLIVALDIIIHEIGHVVAAYKYNVRVGKVGLGIFLFYPVMFVDMSNIWRCKNTQRAVVDIGGTYFQLFLLIILSVIGYFTGDINYHLTNVSIFVAVIINLLPIIKLDGYWLFCDILELDNLSKNTIDRLKSQRNIHKYNSINDNQQNDICKNKDSKYILFSNLYLVSIVIALIVTIVYSINIVKNWNRLVGYFNIIKLDLIHQDVNLVLTHLNEIFIYILPLVFIIYMTLSELIKAFFRRKKHDKTN